MAKLYDTTAVHHPETIKRYDLGQITIAVNEENPTLCLWEDAESICLTKHEIEDLRTILARHFGEPKE